jgi:hypothetical protein
MGAMNFPLPVYAVAATGVLLAGPYIHSADRDVTGEWLESLVRGDLPKIQALVKEGVDVNGALPLASKQRPLHVAAEYGHRNVIVWLIEKGADRRGLDAEGRRPIDYVVAKAESHERFKVACEALAIEETAEKASKSDVLKRMVEEFLIGGKGPVYLRLNGAEPEEAFLKSIPGGPALPFSQRNAGGAEARVQEVTIEPDSSGGFRFMIDCYKGSRDLSGGVSEGIAWRQHGYWFLKTTKHIDR